VPVTFVRALLGAHLLCASGATACFWAAALAAKGQRLHRASGFWFARLAYVTAATGATLALVRLFALRHVNPLDVPAASIEQQTMWLVLYVLLIIVTPIQHGLAVIAAGAIPRRVRSRTHAALNILSMIGSLVLLPAALLWEQWLFLIVVPIGLIVGLRNLSYAGRVTAGRLDWEREHLTSQLTAGITLHTALLVFGTSRTLGLHLTGLASLWPWTVPALLGVPAIVWFRRSRGADPSTRSPARTRHQS
jgi:hypothetical protein